MNFFPQPLGGIEVYTMDTQPSSLAHTEVIDMDIIRDITRIFILGLNLQTRSSARIITIIISVL